MAKLKSNKATSNVEERISNIEVLLKGKRDQVSQLTKEIEALEKERVELELLPFKLGDHVFAEVPAGRVKKRTECVIAYDAGRIYVYPYKSDGCLSSRRFMIIPLRGQTYSDFFEKVE